MRCNGYQTFYCILPQSRFAAILPFKIGHLHFVELMVFVTFLVILLGLPFFDRNERTIDVQSPIFFLITIQQNLHVLEFNLKLKKKINQSHRRVQMDLLLSKANHAPGVPCLMSTIKKSVNRLRTYPANAMQRISNFLLHFTPISFCSNSTFQDRTSPFCRTHGLRNIFSDPPRTPLFR